MDRGTESDNERARVKYEGLNENVLSTYRECCGGCEMTTGTQDASFLPCDVSAEECWVMSAHTRTDHSATLSLSVTERKHVCIPSLDSKQAQCHAVKQLKLKTEGELKEKMKTEVN